MKSVHDVDTVGCIPYWFELNFHEVAGSGKLATGETAEMGCGDVDAAHFVHAPFIGYLWSFERLFLKAPAGPRRFNVLGVPSAVTPELVAVTNDTCINAARVCELLGKISALAMAVPNTLVLDNSRYQRCKAVMECASSLGIEPLFPPPYSPNLNLVKRLWKFVKKKCLYSKYYEKFPAFKAAISECIDFQGYSGYDAVR